MREQAIKEEQIREKFEEWGKSSGVVTDFTLSAPLPVSGVRLYIRETNIAWQAFRYGYNSALTAEVALAEARTIVSWFMDMCSCDDAPTCDLCMKARAWLELHKEKGTR